MAFKAFSVLETRHPQYFHDMTYWTTWREVYDGGEDYTKLYLKKFTVRETDEDFYSRMSITPTPTYAKAAINDVRNAIFQRMRDITRRGGSQAYMKAVAGEGGGVDLKGSTMNGFLGIDVLKEMLVMGKVGVYIDMPQLTGPTLADVGGARPYLYLYQVEDILAWAVSKPEEPSEFQALLLRDTGIDFAQHEMYNLKLPDKEYERYRLIWIDEDTGFVNVQFYDAESNPITPDGYPSDGTPTTLELRRIPFVLFDVGDSLLKDVANHQAALLNLTSSDVAYALKANFPFYTEQQDMRAVGDHLKHPVNPDGSASAGGQRAFGREMRVGPTHGRAYDLRAERPGFIHPSPEPLETSLKLQEKLEDDIRKLVNLAVVNKIGKRATSAEALKMSDQGLEAGLSFIGLVLESGERKIAEHWAAYEEKRPKRRQVATIKYPDRYSLKTDKDRIEEADKLAELMYTVPGNVVKKELSKNIVTALLAGKVNVDTLDKIFAEIDAAQYTTSNPEIIIQAKEAGLVGEQIASMALGFPEDEYLQAREDHAERAKRILEAQTAGRQQDDAESPAARGVEDISAAPEEEGKTEREEATDTTLKETTKKPVRGEGREKQEEE
jgi:hypothetical protein